MRNRFSTSEHGGAEDRGIGTKSHAAHQAFGAFQLARQRVALLLQARDLRAVGHRAVHEFLVLPPVVDSVHFPDPRRVWIPAEIQQHRIKRLEAVLIPQIISKQDVLLEKQHVVLATFDEGQPIVQYVVSARTLFAKQRLARPSQAVFLNSVIA